jgi:hypothetical protein
MLRLRKSGVRFDYCMMDTFWFDRPVAGTWRKPNWPRGPAAWIDKCCENGIPFLAPGTSVPEFFKTFSNINRGFGLIGVNARHTFFRSPIRAVPRRQELLPQLIKPAEIVIFYVASSLAQLQGNLIQAKTVEEE